MKKHYLFSIDLEEVFFRTDASFGNHERVPFILDELLPFLKKHKVNITFFTVGDIAENYPLVIKRILSDGHEIACHSHRHITIDKQSPSDFETDLVANIEALKKAGAKDIKGYRAPNFSVEEKTAWVYPILAKHGITYSSSVLPADNPLFGWKDHGTSFKTSSGVLEMPMSVSKFLHLTIPPGGGIYFRVLPFIWIKRAFKEIENPVLGYMHPYDFDYNQPRIMHPGINNSRFYNFLMYWGRKRLYKRLEKLFDTYTVCTYSTFIEQHGL